jgi:hypothetical protein
MSIRFIECRFQSWLAVGGGLAVLAATAPDQGSAVYSARSASSGSTRPVRCAGM